MALELAPTAGTTTIVVHGEEALHELLSKLTRERTAFYFESLLRSEYRIVVDANAREPLFAFMRAIGIGYAAATR